MVSEDEHMAVCLESYAKEAIPILTQFLSVSSIASFCYAHKLRLKKQEKILEKKKRKLKDKPDYNLLKITDIVGLRLVTLFRSEMPDILLKIVDAIKHINSPNPNPFLRDSIEEIIIYGTNPTFDEIIPIIKDNLALHRYTPDIKESEAGYSSIHIVSRLSLDSKSTWKSMPKEYNLPIEIQIRTVFEDAWGEIDHKYGYSHRSGKEARAPINNPEFVLSHLKILKKFSDACAEYADVIKGEADPTISRRRPPGKVISVSPDEHIISRFSELGVDSTLITKYIEARKIRINATKLFSSNIDNGIQDLLQAEGCYREILGEKGEIPYDEQKEYGNFLFRYYAKMNEAVCLLTTNLVDNIKKAYNIYLHLEEQYKRFPLLSMRLGQCAGKLGKHDIAITKLTDAKDLMQREFENHGSSGNWSDELPEVDYQHMRISVPRLIGYYYWMKGKGASVKKQKSTFFKKAYEATEELSLLDMDNKDDVCKMYNNLLYYGYEYLQIVGNKEKRSIFGKNVASKLQEHLKELEKHVGLDTCSDLDYLDTFAKAYCIIGRYNKMKEICDKILKLSLDPANKMFDDETKVERAQSALRLKSSIGKNN